MRSAVIWAAQNHVLSGVKPEHAPDTLSAYMLTSCRKDPDWFLKEMLKPFISQKDKDAEAERFKDDGRKIFPVIDAIERRINAPAASAPLQTSGIEPTFAASESADRSHTG